MWDNEQCTPGFAFDRADSSNKLRATKTGTTICGVVFSTGVVLGADTRSTNGETVADKNCQKIHYLAPNVYCCGAGTAADTENVTATVSSELLLHRALTGRSNKVITTLTTLKHRLFKYQGHVGAALVLGGFDSSGPHLHAIYPHGSSDSLPYVAMGSGSLAAISILESEFREDMDEHEARELVTKAILAGVFNDLGSGSNVDLCVISDRGTKIERNIRVYNERSSQSSCSLEGEKPKLNKGNVLTATCTTLPET